MTNSPEVTPRTEETAPEFGIVVGVDGSDDSYSALQAAREESRRRGLPLTMISSYSLQPYSESTRNAGHAFAPESVIRSQCEEILDHARETYLADHPEPVHALARFGDPARLLMDASHRADRLVVGAHGIGGFNGRVIGSISAALPEYASCPTLIITRADTGGADRSQQGETPGPSTSGADRSGSVAAVTAGVDGSEHSLAAALEAAREAQERRLPLRLLRAIPPWRSLFSWMPGREDQDALEAMVVDELDGDAAWIQHHHPNLTVQTRSLNATAVDALAEDNDEGRLSVLGATGRGGFLGRRLGSTTRGLLNTAESPVLIVPYRHDGRLQTRRRFPGADETVPAEG